jgi:hypothetical protein
LKLILLYQHSPPSRVAVENGMQLSREHRTRERARDRVVSSARCGAGHPGSSPRLRTFEGSDVLHHMSMRLASVQLHTVLKNASFIKKDHHICSCTKRTYTHHTHTTNKTNYSTVPRPALLMDIVFHPGTTTCQCMIARMWTYVRRICICMGRV